jgi:hypothetical protein
VPEELDSGIRIAKLPASAGVMGRTSFRWSCAAGSVVAIQGVLVAALIIWALVTAAPGAQGDAGSDFLDEKETQVMLIAKQVEVNDAQTCGKQRDYCNYCGSSLSLSLSLSHTHTHS